MKRQHFSLDRTQWAIVGAIAACVIASSARLSSHQMWQDVVIIVSGGVIGIIGLLLALNWRGITERYTTPPIRRLHPKQPIRAQRTTFMRVSGALLLLQAMAAIVSSISWIVALFNNPG